MTRHEHLLTIVMEECAEVQQRASKAQRFGMKQVQQDADDRPEENPERLDNRERLIHEFSDLCAAMEMLGCFVIRRDLMERKKAKVERYFQRSLSCGTLSSPSEQEEP